MQQVVPKAKFKAKDFIARCEYDPMRKEGFGREGPLFAFKWVLVKEGGDKAGKEGKWMETAVQVQE
jgi:hypothetical protein